MERGSSSGGGVHGLLGRKVSTRCASAHQRAYRVNEMGDRRRTEVKGERREERKSNLR
jgi:hypothetical protein